MMTGVQIHTPSPTWWSGILILGPNRGPARPGLAIRRPATVRIPGDSFRNLQSGTVSVWIRPTHSGIVLSSLHDLSNDRQFGLYVCGPG